MSKIKLEVYSHGIRVSGYSGIGQRALVDFCRTIAQFQTVRNRYGGYDKEMIRVFGAATVSRTEYRFHRHMLDDLIKHLTNFGGYLLADIEIIHVPLFIPAAIKAYLDSKFSLRDYQEPIVDFITLVDGDDRIPKHLRAVVLQTGKGKTAIALAGIAKLGVRTAIVIKGMYVKKWIGDVEDAYKNHKDAKWSKGDLIVIRGSEALIDTIELAKAGQLTAKVIIITNTTMQMFISDYEATNGRSEIYGCKPIELYELLGVGIRLIDEVHQDFHLNFKQDLYTHVALAISLSATLEPDDKFLDRMYKIAIPLVNRYSGAEYDAYISAVAVMYHMRDAHRFKCKRRGAYSHVLFEQNIMKDTKRLKAYLDLIATVAQAYYYRKREPRQSLIIFAATKEFCRLLTSHIKKTFPEYHTMCYIEGASYEEFLKADVVISTIKSAGTAVDKPGLRTAILTDALDTSQGNEQVKGRLRRMKEYPDVTPEFVYFCCVDIDKHRRYHERKMEKFAGKVLAHKEVQSGITI